MLKKLHNRFYMASTGSGGGTTPSPWTEVIPFKYHWHIGNWHFKDYYADMQWPAPNGFHVSSSSEWTKVINIWKALGGWANAWGDLQNALLLPFSGKRWYSTSNVTEQGSYWRYRTYDSQDASFAKNLYLWSSVITSGTDGKAAALTIRPFKNIPVSPSSSWTKLYGTSIEAGGIFWAVDLWLISISSDGQTWITIADKNLWATTVWNNWETLSQANCGNYYQWGNNYWFPFTWTVTTSSTRVDASVYWPWNYYSSSIFITVSSAPYNRDASNNNNLRWWETWVRT